MITKIREGKYEIVETKRRTKLLYLDSNAYAWIHPKSIGEILISSHHTQSTDTKVSAGGYVLYEVSNEDYLTDLQHLELEYSNDAWQGYLLPTGLPHGEKIRSRIIPTNQLINRMSFFENHIVTNHPKVLAGAFGGIV